MYVEASVEFLIIIILIKRVHDHLNAKMGFLFNVRAWKLAKKFKQRKVFTSEIKSKLSCFGHCEYYNIIILILKGIFDRHC